MTLAVVLILIIVIVNFIMCRKEADEIADMVYKIEQRTRAKGEL